MLKKTILLLVIGLCIGLINGCSHTNKKHKFVYSKSAGKVLVAGATGRTGRLVVGKLLDQGYTVRVFVRNQEKAKKLFSDSVEIAVGDVKDAESIAAAMQDVRWVISAIGAGGSKGIGNLPEFVDYGGTKNLAEEAVKARVKQFIMVSSRSAGKKNHFLNERHHNVLIWKLKGENVLRESSLNATIIRPGGLSDEAGGKVNIGVFPVNTETKLRRISREDVATVCVSALNNTDAYNKTLVVLNSPETSQLPWNQFFKTIPEDQGVYAPNN